MCTLTYIDWRDERGQNQEVFYPLFDDGKNSGRIGFNQVHWKSQDYSNIWGGILFITGYQTHHILGTNPNIQSRPHVNTGEKHPFVSFLRDEQPELIDTLIRPYWIQVAEHRHGFSCKQVLSRDIKTGDTVLIPQPNCRKEVLLKVEGEIYCYDPHLEETYLDSKIATPVVRFSTGELDLYQSFSQSTPMGIGTTIYDRSKLKSYWIVG